METFPLNLSVTLITNEVFSLTVTFKAVTFTSKVALPIVNVVVSLLAIYL